MDVVHFGAAIELVKDIVDEFKVLGDELAFIDLRLLAKINQAPVEAITRRAPLVLHQ